MSALTPWQRRFRKLAVFAGTLSSLYLLANYTFERLRESRVRSTKDRQIKDRLRTHFTSLLSTISFTLYALFPTMLPQINRHYPVHEALRLLQDSARPSAVLLPSNEPLEGPEGLPDFLQPVHMPVYDAIVRASELAARIRGAQALHDGNHRTALLSFLFALAEASVLVKPDFSLYRAYLHLSQRDHPGNKDNTLNAEARQAAQAALTQYSRSRVRPGTPTIAYLDTCARLVRRLPVVIASVEAAFVTLTSKKYPEGSRGNAYRSLDVLTREYLRQAHPRFSPVHRWRSLPPESPVLMVQSAPPFSFVDPGTGASEPMAPLSECLKGMSEEIHAQAKSSYGAQLCVSSRPLRAQLRTRLSSFDPVRWYQINYLVTSGVTPAGHPSGFNERSFRFREDVRLFELEHPPTFAPESQHETQSRLSQTKKELWSDVKIHSIARALTTAYLVPLLLLLASAQLSTLARIRYLSDVRSALPEVPESTPQHPSEDKDGADTTIVAPARRSGGGWLKSFSVESMGLADYVDANTPGPFASITNLFAGLRKNDDSKLGAQTKESLETEEDRANAERLYLTYSWWLLHQGWQGVANRVDKAVEHVFAGLPVKRKLSTEDWEVLLKEARAIVETETLEKGSTPILYDFATHMLPPHPLISTLSDCPLPTHPESSPYLMNLLDQTRQQLSSPDARHVLDKGISDMFRSLTESLGYTNDVSDSEPLESKRLADCLPRLNQWGEGVWQEVPNSSVEGVLSLPDFESFVALIFGDWA